MSFLSKKKKESKPTRSTKTTKTKSEIQVGEVTHYYGGIGVAIIKFNKKVSTGEKVFFKGATSDFEETISSMQYAHKNIDIAKKGQEVGIKVGQRVREGDKVYISK